MHNRSTKTTLILVFLLAVVFTQSCKMGPSYQELETVEYPQFQTETSFSTDSTQILWWELFNDPTLDTLVTTGLAQNQDLMMAAQRIEQSRMALAYQNKELLPKFNAQASVTSGNFFAGLPQSGDMTVYAGGVGMNWELDFWGKYRRLSEAARAELIASELGYRTMQISLISEIASTYFLLRQTEKSLEVSIETVKLRKNSLEIIQARYDEGIIPEIDLNQAQIQLAIAESAVPFYKRRVGKTKNALSILLGKAPGEIPAGQNIDEQLFTPEIPIGLPSTILERRPDIQRAEQMAIAQNAKIGAAQAMRMPNIGLTGVLGIASTDLQSFTAANTMWQVSGSLLGPIFYWRQNLIRVETERSKFKETSIDYQKSVLVAFKEVENALIDVKTLKEEIIARQAHETAALNAQYLSQQRYDKGVTSYLEVLEAQRQAFDAQLNLASIRQQLLTAYVNLYKSLGGGWISEEEKKAAETPKE